MLCPYTKPQYEGATQVRALCSLKEDQLHKSCHHSYDGTLNAIETDCGQGYRAMLAGKPYAKR